MNRATRRHRLLANWAFCEASGKRDAEKGKLKGSCGVGGVTIGRRKRFDTLHNALRTPSCTPSGPGSVVELMPLDGSWPDSTSSWTARRGEGVRPSADDRAAAWTVVRASSGMSGKPFGSRRVRDAFPAAVAVRAGTGGRDGGAEALVELGPPCMDVREPEKQIRLPSGHVKAITTTPRSARCRTGSTRRMRPTHLGNTLAIRRRRLHHRGHHQGS